MSEPNLVHDSGMTAGDKYPTDQVSVEVVAAEPPQIAQLELCLETQPCLNLDNLDPATRAIVQEIQQQAAAELERQRRLWEDEHASLLTELVQIKSAQHGQVERIRHLEQALDQSQSCLNEMRLQMIDQQFLENQLAATEEIANIQQQAILRLKLQLAQQQETLENQQLNSQERDRNLQELMVLMERLTQTQQNELENLRQQILRDRSELQIYQHSLEKHLSDFELEAGTSQQRVWELEADLLAARAHAGELEIKLELAQTQLKEVSQKLEEHQSTVERLENELRQGRKTLEEQSVLAVESSPVARGSRQAKAISANERELAIAQAKVEELETEIARQLTNQAMLQQACQELEEDRNLQQNRVAELERQTHDMQEQILRQAQQASEYETAVQHWKDRYVTNQSRVLRLKELLEQTFAELPDEVAQLLTVMQASTGGIPDPASPAQITPSSLPTTPKVDLPEFLMRRRSYKSRRS